MILLIFHEWTRPHSTIFIFDIQNLTWKNLTCKTWTKKKILFLHNTIFSGPVSFILFYSGFKLGLFNPFELGALLSTNSNATQKQQLLMHSAISCDTLNFRGPHETHSLSCQLQNRFFVEPTKATKNDSVSLKKDFNFRIRIFCSLQLEFRAWQDIALTYQLHPVAPSEFTMFTRWTPVTTIWRESRGALGETPTCPSCPCHYFDTLDRFPYRRSLWSQ